MLTPVRDFWPFTPRPAVLPLPEPMPRPTRMRRLRAPALSAIWLSFIVRSLSGFLGAHEVTHLVDHAAHRGRVLEDTAAMALVQAEALQRGKLVVRAPDWAAGLDDLDLLLVCHDRPPLGRGLGSLIAVAAADQVAHLLATAGGDHARRVELLQGLEGGL